MNEQNEENKKVISKEYKKHIVINWLLVGLFFVIIGCGYYFYQAYNNKDKVIENANYSYKLEDNEVYLYNNGSIVTEYACQSDCSVYATNNQEYFFDGKILLQDGDNVYLYDLLNSKKVGTNYSSVSFLYKSEDHASSSNVAYFIVTDSFGKQGLVDLKGNITINIAYDALGKVVNNEVTDYSYHYNFIAVKSGDYWGLLSLDKGKGVIDFQYDDIIMTDYDKLAVKEEELYYLVDNDNKKIIPTGYESMTVFENYNLVTQDGYAFMINDEGNVISNKIPVYDAVDYWNKTGLYTELNDNVVDIYITQDGNVLNYFYNEDTKQIESL